MKQNNLKGRLKNIELIIYDFDGVLTDNKVILREDGLESVIVNRADGLAISIIKDYGIKQVILSTEKNKVVEARARKLDISVIQGVNDKKQAVFSYCRDMKVQLKNVAYVGNDINDLEPMKIAGLPICPKDACREIKNVSKIILDAKGGEGVVRDLLRYIKKV
jgi:YrbI family 3-deoxy-D-manno-octulosonate 8-phosphate phosphatase